MNKYCILYTLIVTSISLNVYLGYQTYVNKNFVVKPIATKENLYRYTKPLQKPTIDSNVSENTNILHYMDLKPQMEAEINKFDTNSNTGLFLQDIQTGAWLGINEREGFIPASLLKVPIAMAIFKKVERDEIKLSDTIKLTKEDIDEKSGTLYQKGASSTLTIWEAIKIMILTSDNTAKNVLKRQLNDEELNATFTHVGIPNPYQPQNGQVVSPRGYSRIFKALYFSTFLTAENSEKLLDLATDTQMENLISAGVPSEIQVSHKYGERPDGISDCGIIYHPYNPYLLCIMTRNTEPPEANKLIVNLSKIIYTFVSSR